MERTLLSGLRTFTLGAAVVGIAGISAQAAPIPLNNGGFESPAMANPGDTTTFTNGGYSNSWVAEGPNQWQDTQILRVDGQLDAGQYEGDNVGVMYPGDDASYRQLYQQSGTNTLTAGTTYYISVRVGRGVGEDWASSSIFLTPGDLSSYLAGPFALEATDAGAPAEGKMVWLTTTYTPSADTDFAVGLRSEVGAPFGINGTRTTDYPSAGAVTYFDDVRVDTVAPPPIPEPASVALLGLGASALVMRRRRHA